MVDKLKLQVLLDMADRVSAPLKKMGAGARALGGQLGEAQQALRALERQQAALAKFRGLHDNMRATKERLDAAKTAQAALVAELKKGGAAARAVGPEYRASNEAVNKLTAAYRKQFEQTKKMRTSLAGLGITNALADENRVRAAIEKTTQAIEKKRAAMERMGRIEAQTKKGMAVGAAMAGGGAASVYAGRRTVDAGLSPARTFMAHEDAMLGIARQVPGARSDAGELTDVYRTMETQVRSLSEHIPLATTEIAEMFTAAARMEVPTDKLSEFVLMASEMATAFDAVPEEITESMGKVAKNFKIELTNIRGLADSINYLDDNAISKGADIIEFLNRTSGVVSTVAMSAADAAALGSTLLTLGEHTETAGTAANAIVQKFAAATKGTKKFKSAMQEIGLSVEGVQNGMSTDATGTLSKVIEAIGKLPKSKRIGVMVELVGMEHSDTLAKLVDKPEELSRQLELANSGKAQGSMAREASARTDTLSAQSKMAGNRVFNLGAVVGESLKPALIDFLSVVNPMLKGLADWVAAHPALVAGVGKVVLVVGALLIGLGALLIPMGLLLAKGMLIRFALARMGLSFLSLGNGARMGVALLGRLGGVLARIAPIAATVGRALMFTPVGRALSLLTIAATMVYRNWSGIMGGLGAIYEGMSNRITEALQGGIGKWVALFMDWSPVGILYSVVAFALDALGITLPDRFSTLGGQMLDGLINGIKAKAAAVKDAIVGVAASAGSWFADKLQIKSPSRVFMEYGGWISEGAAIGMQRGQKLAGAAAVALAAATTAPMVATAAPMAMASGAGGGGGMAASAPAAGGSYQITINAAPGMDPRAIAQAVRQELDKRERAQRGRVMSQLSDME